MIGGVTGAGFLLIINDRKMFVKKKGVGVVIRTDLAVEVHNRIRGKREEVHGVRVEAYEETEGLVVTTVCIETENASKEMGRPKGCYVTIDFSEYQKKNDEYENVMADTLASVIEEWLPAEEEKDGFTIGKQGEANISVLVAGLGNAKEIIDALGPKVVEQIPKSRHIMKEFGKYGYGSKEVSRISGIIPGVQDATGMEAQEILKGIVRETEPDVLIAIDALVGRSGKRIGKTIQLTNAGIIPGSGVGNHRKEISKETMGIPVITIGVPVVMDASYGYFLVPKEVTVMVEQLSKVIAAGIEKAFYE